MKTNLISIDLSRTVKDQQDHKSLHQEFNGEVVNNATGQPQAKYTNLHQVLLGIGLNPLQQNH